MDASPRLSWAALAAFALAALALAGCPADRGDRPAPPVPTPTASALSTTRGAVSSPSARSEDNRPLPEATTIVKTVEQAQRAGLERHDLAGYMAIWADDAKLVAARGDRKGRYDTTLTRAQIEATRKVRFSAPPPQRFAMELADADVRITGDRATLTWTVATDQGGLDEQVAERYELRKTEQGWKVTLNRYWPLRTAFEGKTTRYDEATWERLDAAVAAARRAGDARTLLVALADAWRFVEAHGVAKRITGQAGATASDWRNRSAMALLAGDAADGKASRAKADKP